MINQKIIKILGNGLQEKTVKETNDFLLSKDLPWYFSQTSIIDDENSLTTSPIEPTGTPNIIKSEFFTDFLRSS